MADTGPLTSTPNGKSNVAAFAIVSSWQPSVFSSNCPESLCRRGLSRMGNFIAPLAVFVIAGAMALLPYSISQHPSQPV
jgi:hypothetical protein